MNYYITSTVVMTINGLVLGLAHSDEELEDALSGEDKIKLVERQAHPVYQTVHANA